MTSRGKRGAVAAEMTGIATGTGTAETAAAGIGAEEIEAGVTAMAGTGIVVIGIAAIGVRLRR